MRRENRDRGPLESRGGQCHAPGLSKAMHDAGIRVATLSEKTGYSPQTIGDLLQGGITHRMVVSRIASVLHTDPAMIRGEIQEDQKEEESR